MSRDTIDDKPIKEDPKHDPSPPQPCLRIRVGGFLIEDWDDEDGRCYINGQLSTLDYLEAVQVISQRIKDRAEGAR